MAHFYSYLPHVLTHLVHGSVPEGHNDGSENAESGHFAAPTIDVRMLNRATLRHLR